MTAAARIRDRAGLAWVELSEDEETWLVHRFQRWLGDKSELAVMRLRTRRVERLLRRPPGRFDESSPDWAAR